MVTLRGHRQSHMIIFIMRCHGIFSYQAQSMRIIILALYRTLSLYTDTSLFDLNTPIGKIIFQTLKLQNRNTLEKYKHRIK